MEKTRDLSGELREKKAYGKGEAERKEREGETAERGEKLQEVDEEAMVLNGRGYPW